MTRKLVPAAAALLAPALALALAPALAAAADLRAAAEVECQPAADLVYDCRVLLTDRATGAPLEGVALTIGAQMPSMPMAHNVRPVQAEAAPEPGAYDAQLELEMYGTWALQLDLAGPLRDRVVATLDFQPANGEAGAGNEGGHRGSHRH